MFKLAPKCVCAQCHAENKGRLRGSALITFALLCLGIVPGLLYSSWRGSGARLCRSCGAPTLVPLKSPRGKALAA